MQIDQHDIDYDKSDFHASAEFLNDIHPLKKFILEYPKRDLEYINELETIEERIRKVSSKVNLNIPELMAAKEKFEKASKSEKLRFGSIYVKKLNKIDRSNRLRMKYIKEIKEIMGSIYESYSNIKPEYKEINVLLNLAEKRMSTLDDLKNQEKQLTDLRNHMQNIQKSIKQHLYAHTISNHKSISFRNRSIVTKNMMCYIKIPKSFPNLHAKIEDFNMPVEGDIVSKYAKQLYVVLTKKDDM